MAVRIVRTKTRPNLEVDFQNTESSDIEIKFQNFENQMLNDGKIISLSSETSNDNLSLTKTFIFRDIDSVFEYFRFFTQDVDFAKADYEAALYNKTNAINTSVDVNWNFTV